jgi:nitrogen regulatory protein PII
MHSNNRILVTIITESSLETPLSRELEALGVQGYTINDARGRGSNGFRNADWDADSNIRIEVICSEPMSQIIIDILQHRYYPNFAMVMYSHEVFVLRPNKFK